MFSFKPLPIDHDLIGQEYVGPTSVMINTLSLCLSQNLPIERESL